MANADKAGTVPEEQTPGQAGQTPQGQGENPAGNAQGQTPLTLEQVQAVIEQSLAAREQRAGRALQSQLDKRDANILKRINDARTQQTRIVSAARAKGMDAGQAQAVAQSIMDEEIAAILEEQKAAEQAQQQQAQQQAQQPQDEAQAVTAYARTLINTLGLSESDPELLEAYQAMKGAKTPEEYIGTIRAAYHAKVKRELTAGSGTERQQANPARLVGLGADGGQRAQGNPIKDTNNPSQLYKMAVTS